ncbi:MAG: hypothetical protein AAGL69_16160 [Pseudomonadota bacterium]
MAAPKATWHNTVRVADRYVRAVNIERDLPDPEALRGYRLTGRAEAALKRILSGLHDGSTQRAWRLTGPYGGGKSSLALLLACLFRDQFARNKRAGKLVHASAPDVHKLGAQALAYRPLVVQGHFADVSIAIAEAVLDQLTAQRNSAARKKLTKDLKSFIAKRNEARAPADGVLDLLDEFADLETRSTSPFVGVIVIIDELGRFLDYAASEQANLDAGFFQALAERAAGKRETAIATVGILHQRFEDYARAGSTSDRSLEWRKVAERFEEVTLEEPIDGSLALINDAIELTPNRLSAATRKAANARVKLGDSLGVLPSDLRVASPSALYPLHPATALALSVLSRRLGQTERSVFSFLTSQDVGGFQAFLAATAPEPDCAYRLSDLCDYLLAHGASYLADSERNKRWSMLQERLRGAPLHNPVELNVLKTVGVLNVLEPMPGIACTLEHLSFAIADQRKNRAVTQAVANLIKKGVLFKRQATDELCVWPRSSVDLAGEYQRAVRQVGPVHRLDTVLADMPSARPVVAHRHYIETGTLRTLDVRVLPDIKTLKSGSNSADAFDAALLIVPVYPTDDLEGVATALRAASKSQPLGVVCTVQVVSQAALDAARDISAWRLVSDNCAELRVDAVAKSELADALARSQERLDRTLTGFLTLQGEATIQLFHQGKTANIGSGAALSRWVSKLMDEKFPQAPVFHNELINRVSVSTQAATARGRLLAAMLGNEQQQALGIRKTPPEKALYWTLFATSGMHRKVRGVWQFAPPAKDSSWSAAWQSVVDGLTGRTPATISQVVATLTQPPIGLREAPALVLCVAVLLANRYQLALREDGSFVTELTTPHLDRMAKSPDRFDARILPATKANADLVEIYAKVFAADQNGSDIGDVLRSLYRWYLELPSYTLQTRSVAKPARALLTAMSKAAEPVTLLKEALPEALGVKINARATPTQRDALKRALTKQVNAINAALPELMDRIRAVCASSFGLPATAPISDLRQHISSLCELAGPMPAEPDVSALKLRTDDTERSDAQWLDSVANLMATMAPGAWEDDTLSAFELSMSRLATLLSRVAVISNAAKQNGTTTKGIVGVHIVDVSGRDKMLTVNTAVNDPAADKDYARIRKVVATSADPQRVLAKLLSEFALAKTD